VKLAAVLFVVTVLACSDVLLAQTKGRPLGKVPVTIIPAKVTLFAGETQRFVATVKGIDDKDVTWSVEEKDGGTINELGQYTAPKIQGVYHVVASSRARPQASSVATVTVLTYCDPLPAFFRR
jgi:Bacterial Ig-like domain (group 2)